MNNILNNVNLIISSLLQGRENVFSKYLNFLKNQKVESLAFPDENEQSIILSSCFFNNKDIIEVQMNENNSHDIQNFLKKIGFEFDSEEYNIISMKINPENITSEKEKLINQIIENFKPEEFLKSLSDKEERENEMFFKNRLDHKANQIQEGDIAFDEKSIGKGFEYSDSERFKGALNLNK
jgi:hypothetical protein